MNNAFVSIVEHYDDPDLLVVRGRFPGDVSRFLGVPVGLERETTHTDYRYRIAAPRKVVEEAVLLAVRGISYPNFKNSIRDYWRKALALSVWSIFADAQAEGVGR